MSADDMTEAEKAYAAAETKIAAALEWGDSGIDFSENITRRLETIPPQIAQLTQLEVLSFSFTQVSDLSPLATLANLEVLLLEETKVSTLAPIRKLINLVSLSFDKTDIDDLSPIVDMAQLRYVNFNKTPVDDLSPLLKIPNFLGHKNTGYGLTFTDCVAAKNNPKIKAISEIEDNTERAQALFDYLQSQPQKNMAPTLEQVMDAQDRTGWRFSISDSAFELFVHNDDITEQQKKMGAQTRERLQKLHEKLQFGNAFAIRADVLDEVQSFLALLDDETTAWSDNALGLWASLIALGGQLEANDQAMAIGRAELDCLKSEERAALQTFLAVGSNFVRSFPDTKDLDDAYTAYSRTKVPVERLISLINGAIDQKLLTSDSTALISNVANVAKGKGTQADKAHGVTVTGMANLVKVAAITGTAVGSGLIAGGVGKIGSDIVDHYDLPNKATGFLDSMSEEINALVDSLPIDEKAGILSVLRDLEKKKLER